jgi:hypothetical protein
MFQSKVIEFIFSAHIASTRVMQKILDNGNRVADSEASNINWPLHGM